MIKPIELRDTVRHKTSAIPVMGIVLTIYNEVVDNKLVQTLDVQVGEEIYWSTPIENWEHVESEEQREGWTKEDE